MGFKIEDSLKWKNRECEGFNNYLQKKHCNFAPNKTNIPRVGRTPESYLPSDFSFATPFWIGAELSSA